MSFKTYVNIFWPYRGVLCVIFSLAAISALLGIGTVHLNGVFIDTVLVAQSLEQMGTVLLLFAGAVLSGLVLRFIKSLLIPQTKEKLRYTLKCYLLAHQQEGTAGATYLAKRIDQDSRVVIDFVMNHYSSIPIRVIELGVVGTLLLRINQSLGLLLFVVIVIYVTIYHVFRQPIVVKSTQMQEQSAQFFSLYSTQFVAYDKPAMDQGFASYLRDYKAYVLVNTLFTTLKGLVSGGVNILVFIIGSLWVIRGQVSIGELTVLMMYFNQMLTNVGYYLELGRTWGIAKASLKRLDELV